MADFLCKSDYKIVAVILFLMMNVFFVVSDSVLDAMGMLNVFYTVIFFSFFRD